MEGSVNSRVALFPAVCLAVVMFVPAAVASPQVKAVHEARSLQPGEVVLLRVSADAPIEKVRASALNRDYSFFETGDPAVRETLIGLDLNVKPGSYRVRITGRCGDEAFKTSDVLKVVAKKFPVRHITVDEKFANPPATVMDRITREQKLVSSIFQGITATRYWRAPFHRPVPGAALSSFGKRSIVNGQPRSPHSGTDFRASTGTPVESPNDGKVVLAQNLYFSGNTVIIDHGMGLYSYLCHLSAFRVKEGQEVHKGTVVGLVGATGRVTGPHLHWTTRLLGARVDPLSLMSVLADVSDSVPLSQ